MGLDLIALAEHCPDLTLSVKASDLLEVGRILKEELPQEIKLNAPENTPQAKEEFRTCEETMEILHVSSATLWRWKKSGYLVPVSIGPMDRYRLSDINNILMQKGGAL